METKKTKKEIVQMLLKKELDTKDEEELMNMLLDEPISVDVDKQSDENRSFGDRLADKITEVAGSWTFIISMILFLVLWVVLNVYILEEADPYPFILLNLLLSCIAALQAPIIMMSQNREAKKDRLRSSNDYKTDLKSELILEELHNEMKKILANQNKILKYIIFIGAAGLTIVAVVPFFFNGVFGASVSFGGTSIIIVVGVILETIKQIQSQLLVQNYSGFLSE